MNIKAIYSTARIHRGIALLLAATLLFYSCASTTIIRSTPDAKLYLNGEPVGETPYSHTDTKIVGSTNTVRLEKEGYETLTTSFSRNEEADVGAIIGGILVLVPFLWTMKYKPVHTYELELLSGEAQLQDADSQKTTATKSQRLRELKSLLDDGIITKEEFENEKKKVLEEK